MKGMNRMRRSADSIIGEIADRHAILPIRTERRPTLLVGSIRSIVRPFAPCVSHGANLSRGRSCCPPSPLRR